MAAGANPRGCDLLTQTAVCSTIYILNDVALTASVQWGLE